MVAGRDIPRTSWSRWYLSMNFRWKLFSVNLSLHIWHSCFQQLWHLRQELFMLLHSAFLNIVTFSPLRIVWRYIVMQLSHHFQNIVNISLSPTFWEYHTILIMRYALWIAFKVLLTLRPLDSLHLQGHAFSMNWYIFLPLLCIWCIQRVALCVCISRVLHYLLTNFASIMIHEISLILCDYRIKSQNIV